MPRFSIVVPAYNAESTLAETLDAILAQTYDDWECIVVDDGSVDRTLQLACEYALLDCRIRVIHQDNRGSAGAYNTGVSSAVGGYVVLCSADDVLLSNHLSSMSRFIDEQTSYGIYSSNGYFWRPDGSRTLVYGRGHREGIHSLELDDVIRCCFYSVGAVYRRELFHSVGGYRADVFGEDYDFWLRAMASGARHRYLPEALSLHRVSPAQKSASLEAAYQSDIRLVSDLMRSFPLSPTECRAVDECIRERERLIGDLGQPGRSLQSGSRAVAVRAALWVMGDRNVRRLSALLRRTPSGTDAG